MAGALLLLRKKMLDLQRSEGNRARLHGLGEETPTSTVIGSVSSRRSYSASIGMNLDASLLVHSSLVAFLRTSIRFGTPITVVGRDSERTHRLHLTARNLHPTHQFLYPHAPFSRASVSRTPPEASDLLAMRERPQGPVHCAFGEADDRSRFPD